MAEFHKDQRVRLKNQPADIYRRAYGGSEGIVRKTKKDEFGYPMIYIEWDKNHWTYNGEEDMWTFADHFDPVERIEMPRDDSNDSKLIKDLINFLDKYQKNQGQDNTEANPEEDQERRERRQVYAETVQEAFEKVVDGEAFLMVCVEREGGESASIYNLVPYIFASTITEEAATLLEVQLSQILATMHQNLGGKYLARLAEDERGQGHE